MENKNVMLAFVVSVGFMLLWSIFVMPRIAPKTAVPAPVMVSTSTATSPALVAANEKGAKSAPLPSEVSLRDAENAVTFASQGGAIRHWRLVLKGQEIDLTQKPDVKPYPLTTFEDSAFAIREHKNEAVLQTTLPNGLSFTKTLTLSQTGHLHNLTYTFKNAGAKPVEMKDWAWGWGPGLGTVAAEQKENVKLTRALSKNALKARVLKPGDHSDVGEWAGVDNRYFLVAFIPVSDGSRSLRVIDKGTETTLLIRETFTVPAHGETVLKYEIYAGPKGYTYLSQYKKGLESSVDFGMFGILGKVILRAIYWLQSKTGNYGWAIIILTVILQLLLLPLSKKSFKSMQAMKELQPKIAALQTAYKEDPKRLNLEMMNLYKKSGTNPFGGCLPMLLQLPIFWALFTTLRNAYELRGAPFMGWITDLAAPDTIHLLGVNIHILPLLMGAGMFFQQRMSGAVTDPTQRQMMFIFPIMMMFMFWGFPSGLVLYWFVQSLMAMMIQATFLRMHHRKPKFELVQ